MKVWLSIIFLVAKFGGLFSSSYHGDLQKPCNFDVSMKQILRNEGFHRNMTYSIVFSGKDDHNQWLYNGCEVAVLQHFPPGVYVNGDELNDLTRSQRLTAVPTGRVNIELPAEQSTDSSVYVKGRVAKDRAYLWVPVHARYHKAVKGGGFARNTISAPLLYLRCADERLSLCNRTVSFLCDRGNRDNCIWTEVPYDMITYPVRWDVPVGDTDHYYVVATVTIAVIVAGSLYLLNIIHQYKAAKVGNYRKTKQN